MENSLVNLEVFPKYQVLRFSTCNQLCKQWLSYFTMKLVVDLIIVNDKIFQLNKKSQIIHNTTNSFLRNQIQISFY